jgi:superfamily I DNA/RNA helicase
LLKIAETVDAEVAERNQARVSLAIERARLENRNEDEMLCLMSAEPLLALPTFLNRFRLDKYDQDVQNQTVQGMKQKEGPVFLSTIHASKGLEFPEVLKQYRSEIVSCRIFMLLSFFRFVSLHRTLSSNDVRSSS